MKRIALVVGVLLMITAGIALVLSCILLFQSYEDYQKGTNTYEEMSHSYIQQPDKEKEERKDSRETQQSKGSEETVQGNLQIDFEGLQEVNPEIIGWIEIPGLALSYPLLQGKDNAYYLTHLADRQPGVSGSIFVDYHNQPDFSDRNTIIYGHNMKDGSMFAKLDQYDLPELYQKEPYFYIYIPGEVLKYQIFSCYAGSVGSEAYTYEFPKIEEFQAFLQTIQSYAAYDTGTEIEGTERVATLSTCVNTNRNYRYLIHGVLREVIDMSE